MASDLDPHSFQKYCKILNKVFSALIRLNRKGIFFIYCLENVHKLHVRIESIHIFCV